MRAIGKHVSKMAILIFIGSFSQFEKATAVVPSLSAVRPNDSSTESEKVVLQNAKKKAAEATQNSLQIAEYHFSLAQGYSNEGNTDLAIEEYKLTTLFDPDSALVYSRLAAEYIKKGMLSDAMDAAKEAVKKNPKYIDARLILAGLYSILKSVNLAVQEYDQVLKYDPKNEEASVYRALALIEDGRAQQALTDLRQFVKKVKDAPLAYFYIGRAEQQLGKSSRAIEAFEKSLKLRPNFVQAALALGSLYEDQKLDLQATVIYKKFYDKNQDVSVASRLADLLLKHEKYKEAIPYLRVVKLSDSDDMNSRVKLGLVYLELKSFDEAIGEFKEILAKNPESDRVHFYLGSLYEVKEAYSQAVDELKEIKPGSPLFAESALHIGYLFKKMDKLDEAREHIEKVISEEPKYALFHVFKASLEDEKKDTNQAIKTLENAAQMFPDDVKVRYFLGILYDRKGDFDKSLSQMELILKQEPDHIEALNYVGYTWTNQGVRLGDAEVLIKKAMKLKPGNAYILDSWGWHLLVRGRVSEAVVELEKAAKLLPKEAIILEHLGDAYLRANLRSKALNQYIDALKVASSEEMKVKIRKKVDQVTSDSTDRQVAKQVLDSPSDSGPKAK